MCKEKVNRWWVKARHLGRGAIVTVTRRHSSSRGSVQYYFLLFKYNFIHLITIEMFTVICGKQYFFMTSTKILFRYDISLSANVTSYKILSCLYQQYYRVFLFLTLHIKVVQIFHLYCKHFPNYQYCKQGAGPGSACNCHNYLMGNSSASVNQSGASRTRPFLLS